MTSNAASAKEAKQPKLPRRHKPKQKKRHLGKESPPTNLILDLCVVRLAVHPPAVGVFWGKL
jgi:hypothetical protein